MISEGKTGYLVSPHRPQEMAERILTLLNDDALCVQMGMIARQHAQRYSNEQMVKQIVSLYVELFKKYHGGDLSRA